MPLKAEDLHSFEAYKKAMRAAAGQIGKNTPFCIYSDAQLPDASKKTHILKPFVVVGSPVALIAPWLKTLKGTKTFIASGTCSLQNGRISLAPDKGKVNYGQIKTQSTTIKDLFGKEILVPAAGAGGDEDEDEAPAAMAQAPAAAAATIKPPAPPAAAARTTLPPVPPMLAQSAAKVAPPEPHPVRLAKASTAWHGTRNIIHGKCKELKQAIRTHFGNSHPDVLRQIEANMHKIDVVVDKLDHRLAVSMQKASQATNEAARAAELRVAGGILNEYINYCKSAALIAHIDENPFGVQCNLRHILASSLTQMKQSLMA